MCSGESSQTAAIMAGGYTPRTIRVVVADAYRIVRYGLREMLMQEAEIQVVAECTGDSDLVRVVNETHADILILEFEMSNLRVWAVLEELGRTRISIKVIVLTSSEDKNQFVQALKLGCSGIVLKQAATEEIVECVRKVHAGEIWLDSRATIASDLLLSRNTANSLAHSNRGRERVLFSRREREILALIANGCTNSEIAAKLFISLHTVKNHVHHMYAKIGVSDRLELALYALHTGLHLV